MVLGEISDGSLVPPDDSSAIRKRTIVTAGLSQLRFRHCWRVRKQCVYKCGLARAIAPHQRYFLASYHARRETGNYFGIAVRLRKAFDLKNVFARGPLL